MEQVLEALGKSIAITMADIDLRHKAITAIKQALALDKMAENARELGLDYEPVDGTQVSKVWWDGEKSGCITLMAKPIPLEDIYHPVDWKAEYLKSVESGCITLDELREANAELAATNRQVEILSDALAESQRQRQSAQRQWVGLTVLEQADCFANTEDATEFYHAIEAKLKEKNT